MLRKRNALIVFLSLVFLLTALHGIAFAYTEVDPESVTEITFEPGEPREYIENDIAHGYFDFDDEEERYFVYTFDFVDGDKLLVTTEDGVKEYVYQHLDDDPGLAFVNGDELIPAYMLNWSQDNQEVSHW